MVERFTGIDLKNDVKRDSSPKAIKRNKMGFVTNIRKFFDSNIIEELGR